MCYLCKRREEVWFAIVDYFVNELEVPPEIILELVRIDFEIERNGKEKIKCKYKGVK